MAIQTVTGVFSSLAAARGAVRDLHAAGLTEQDIALQVSGAADAPPNPSARHSERIGRQAGTFFADIGQTAAAFVPFVGSDLVEGPIGRAFRDASESAGAATGRLVDVIAEGAIVTVREVPEGTDDRVSVSVRAETPRENNIREILMRAGALRITVEG